MGKEGADGPLHSAEAAVHSVLHRITYVDGIIQDDAPSLRELYILHPHHLHASSPGSLAMAAWGGSKEMKPSKIAVSLRKHGWRESAQP